MNATKLRTLAITTGALAGLASPALAHLGSFTKADGYSLWVPSGAVNWCDVTYYNAGAWGVNSGGGSGPTPIAPDSGLWSLVSPVGGFFPSAAARNAAVGSAPPYPTVAPAGTIPAYIVGDHFPGRTGDNANLAVRNDTPAGTGSIQYDYALDTYDFGGPVPSSVTSGPVSMQFYFMPDPGTQPQPGRPARDKFVMSLKDSSGNTGLQWGYTDDNEIYWRDSSSNAWNYTGVYANIANWDGVRMDLDLTNDTFGIDYYNVNTNTWSNMVAAGTAMGSAMTNFTTVRWELADAVNVGVGGKNFFDDFSFAVPEPSSLVLLLGGLASLLRRRG
ncbi:MAG: PEP-CTERM sorting domain-containing protein [Planctomycetes bacterium]|nr:PEP-CTERM sorting domain-containing protein [Planctomycetota bacterium]